MSKLLDALIGLTNAAEPVEGWVTGGQPTEQQLKAFKAAGGEVIVDNRDPMEPHGYDEPTAARKLGLEYVSLPIVHGAVTVGTLRQMHEMLRKLSGRKALLHCSSGNRTSAGLIPYLMKEEEMDEEEAVDVAMRGGLRSAELLEVAREYVATSGS